MQFVQGRPGSLGYSAKLSFSSDRREEKRVKLEESVQENV